MNVFVAIRLSAVSFVLSQSHNSEAVWRIKIFLYKCIKKLKVQTTRHFNDCGVLSPEY